MSRTSSISDSARGTDLCERCLVAGAPLTLRAGDAERRGFKAGVVVSIAAPVESAR